MADDIVTFVDNHTDEVIEEKAMSIASVCRRRGDNCDDSGMNMSNDHLTRGSLSHTDEWIEWVQGSLTIILHLAERERENHV